MRLVSLFAGIGGFDLGFERAGFDTVATVEIDANCRKLLAGRWPKAVHLDDVRTAGRHNLPDCDVLTFGFPCQDLSVAGKRAGIVDGERSSLFREALRIADELDVTWILFENVTGLLSGKQEEEESEDTEGCGGDEDNGGRADAEADRGGSVPTSWMGVLLSEVGKRGYAGAWRVLDAQWFGVAQRRRRVFGLFTRLDSGAGRCAEILSVAESLRGHPAPSREAWEGFTHGVAPCIGASGRGFERAGETRGQDPVVAVPIQEIGKRQSGTPMNGVGYGKPGDPMFTLQRAAEHGVFIQYTAHTLRAEVFDASEDGTGRGTPIIPAAYRTTAFGEYVDDGTASTMKMRDYKDATDLVVGPIAFDMAHGDDPARFTGDKTNTLQSRMGTGGNQVPCVAFDWKDGKKARSISIGNNLAPTLATQGDRYAMQCGMQVRRLTPKECERLQGFPDDWTAGFADSVRYRMLGNAVCVNVAEWIAKRLAKAMIMETNGGHSNK